MAIRPNAEGLVDYLPTKSLTARQIAYNNTLDRMRMELPPSGDPGSSGVVQINLDNLDGAVPVIIRDRAGDEIEVTDNGIVTVDTGYHQVLEGDYYSVSKINPSLPTASSHVYLIDMDPAYDLSLVSTIKGVGEFHVEMYEGASVSGSGNLLYPHNFKRTSASGVSTRFYDNSWVNPSGTKIYESITSDDKSDMSTESVSFWYLDATQNFYVVSVTNQNSGNAASSVEFKCKEIAV